MGNTLVRPVKVGKKKQKVGGASKKGRQHAHNEATHKYERQAKRTAVHKKIALANHLRNNPMDEQNKKDIGRIYET